MIDAEQHTTCKACGRSLIQKGGGHRKRSYCDDRCKQIAYRKRKKRPQDSAIVTIDEQEYQARIAALEQEIATLEVQLSKRTYTSGKVRARLQRRLMDTGKVGGYPAVTIRITIGQGVDAWRTFARDAREDMLARAIVAAGGS
jgi:uncharacterized small protein (DUF1192 family)